VPKPKKSTAQTTDSLPVGALRPQKHGGALRNGGTNKGGPGRPPDEIRALLRAFGYRRLPDLFKQWGRMTLDQRTALMDRVVLKYGIGTHQEIEHEGAVGIEGLCALLDALSNK
jgi:hypothetical protein